MSTPKAETPCTEYFSARSRTCSVDSRCSEMSVNLAPITDEGKASISVSSNVKRQFKDTRIYVNPRTGLPVRPPTSFALFKHALRRSMKGDKVKFFEFNEKATKKWIKMKDEDKEPYVERAKKLSDRFKKIEVTFLRKKVRELEKQVKDYKRELSYGSRRG